LENAAEVFSKDRPTDQGPSVKDLHAKIGQLSMENDFLSVALGRIADATERKEMIDKEDSLRLLQR
jgi:hypothetical protein